MPSSTACLFSTGNAPGKSQANGASVRIRRIAEARRAGAERLGQGLQLHVNFETDDRLVPRHDFGRDACEAFLCHLRHKSRLVYHPSHSFAGRASSGTILSSQSLMLGNKRHSLWKASAINPWALSNRVERGTRYFPRKSLLRFPSWVSGRSAARPSTASCRPSGLQL